MLALDVGNTLAKWRIATIDGSTQEGFCHTCALQNYLPKLLEQYPVRKAFISWVGSAVERGRIVQLLEQRGLKFQLLESQKQNCGLVNGYSNYALLGVDRWIAMLGVWIKNRSEFCVVDAGTALTIDFVNEAGVHLGGYILPGLKTMMASLDSATELINVDKDISGERSLEYVKPGNCTKDAVTRGALIALAGGIQYALDRFAEGSQLRKPLCVIGGGDSRTIRQILKGDWVVSEQLVLDGIFEYANHHNDE